MQPHAVDSIPPSVPDVPGQPSPIARIGDLLAARYGTPRWQPHHSPLAELILTVLSQHTSDINSGRAYRSLRTRFATWDDVRTAPLHDVVTAIQSGGLANIKATRIRRILDAVLDARAELDLSHLETLSSPAAYRWLTQLPGVGPKTAACVLLFALGRPALPVDTHVYRVALRLGLISSEVGMADAQTLLAVELGADRDRVYAFHLNLIAHGRSVCTARRPFCDRCPLTECCDYFIAHPTPADLGRGAAEPVPPNGG